jgi:hypothetical protein
VDEKITNITPEIKARIKQIKKDNQANKLKDGNKQSSQQPSRGAFTIYQAGAYNTTSNYKLRNSFILNSGTTIHVVNNQARFISDIKPTLDRLYAGLNIEEIVGYSTAIVIINRLIGKTQMQLLRAAYVPSFYTNLVCL